MQRAIAFGTVLLAVTPSGTRADSFGEGTGYDPGDD